MTTERTQERPHDFWKEVAISGLHLTSATLLLLVAAASYMLGLLPNLLVLFLLGMVPFTIVNRAWLAWRGQLAPFAFLRKREIPRVRLRQAAQFLVRLTFWGLLAWSLQLSLIPSQFSPEDWKQLALLLSGCWLVDVAGLLLPSRRVRLVANLIYIAGVVVLGSLILEVVRPADLTDAVVIDSPVRGYWLVVQGGQGSLTNHHVPHRNQRHALDLARLVKGQLREGELSDRSSYFSQDQPLLAPADGEVVAARGDQKDQKIGESDLSNPVGNHLILKIAPNRFVLLAHLEEGSLKVKPGERVKRGQLIARCGNSGNTSFPHLHLQVQDTPAFDAPGTRTFPLLFRSQGGTRLVRGSVTLLPDHDLPRRNDHILTDSD